MSDKEELNNDVTINETDSETESRKEYTCKNCGRVFIGNFCPECGQSVKEYERPFQFLIIDFMGNMFAFDTRFWKTLVAVLFKPGTLALDYVKGHRVRYMPPFRFYIFISFVFFFLLNIHSSRLARTGMENMDNTKMSEEFKDFDWKSFTDTLEIDDDVKIKINERFADTLETGDIKPRLADTEDNAAVWTYLKDHPEAFLKQLLTNLSWSMFFLMPFYGVLLWIFFRKARHYYITHLIMAINQHAFMFVVLLLILVLSMVLPGFSSSFRGYLLLLIPLYSIIGYKILYQQRIWKIIVKMFAIGMVYSIVLFTVAIAIIVLAAVQNGIS